MALATAGIPSAEVANTSLASTGTSEASAVDLSAIEHQKENIQPLAAGRSAKALHTLFTADRKTLRDELKEGHDRFNREIAEAEEEGVDDPLDVYHRYVRWTLASYPSGPSHDSHLIPLLERTTRRFVLEEQYRSDVRLVKLWMLYAKYVDTPRDIFRFLEGRQVGSKLALFYEEWAMLEEQASNFDTAARIYELGIARRAQPLERLKKRRQAFQTRMMLPRPAPLSAGPSQEASSFRPALGRSEPSGTSNLRGAAMNRPVARALTSNNGASAFAVFQDASNENTDLASTSTGWTDFGTNATRRRENERSAVPWKGETLNVGRALPNPPQGFKIEVFRDEEAEIPGPAPPVSHNGGDRLAFKGLRAPGEAETLRRNPFRNYEWTVELADLPSAAASSQVETRQDETRSKSSGVGAKQATQSSPPGKGKRAERVACRVHDIYPDGFGGAEYSFEELAAVRRGLRASGHDTASMPSLTAQHAGWEREVREQGRPWRCHPDGSPVLRDEVTGEPQFEYLRQQDRLEQEKQRRREEEERAADAVLKRQEEEEEQQRQRREEAQAQERQQRQQELERERQMARPPSPTINTRAALAEVNAMFSKTMKFGDEPNDSTSDSETEGSDASRREDPVYEIGSQPLPPSQAETDDTFWSQGLVQSQQPLSQLSLAPTLAPGSEASTDSGTSTEDSDDEAEDLRGGFHRSPERYAPFGMTRSSSTVSSTDSNLLEGSARTSGYPGSSSSSENESEARSRSPQRQALKANRKAPASETGQHPPSEPRHEPSDWSDQEEDADLRQHVPLHADPLRTPGYALGRRVDGYNRFADMMDVLSPITERTCEFGMATTTFTAKDQHHWASSASAHEEDERYAVHKRKSIGPKGSQDYMGSSLDLNDDRISGPTQITKRGEDANSDTSVAPDGANTHIELTHGATNGMMCSSEEQVLTPCDPLAVDTVRRIMAGWNQHGLGTIPEFRDHRSSKAAKLSTLQKMTKSRRASNAPRSSSAQDDAGLELNLADDFFSVREKLGEGGYGAVFRVAELADVDGDETMEEDGQMQTAMKVERPANLWEFFILQRLHERLPDAAARAIVRPQRLYAFEDESYLLLDYCDQGTLLDAVNNAKDAGVTPAGLTSLGFEEVVAMFFTIEVTRVLEAFHAAGFLHGDFKIDNCLLRLEEVPGGSKAWSSAYRSDGSGGWSSKGVRIIDFGRTIDLKAFPDGQTFSTDWTTDKHDCAEMREGRPWTYQPDYYGLACIAHVLLFGKYLETTAKHDDTGHAIYAVKEPFKRYHQATLWQRFFDLLLNPTSVREGGPLPLTMEIATIRRDMEVWLEANSEKTGKSLRTLLKKLEISVLARHK